MLNHITYGEPDLPPLLLAHGLYGQARNWGTITKTLGDIRHCVSVDMRNHGDSPWMDSHGYQDMAEDLAQVLTQALPSPADVLGHSMGGKAAMALALTHPGKVRRLIVADIAPVAYDHDQMALIRAMQALDLTALNRRTEAAQALARTGIDASVASFLTQSLDLGTKRWKMNLAVLASEMPKILDFPQFASPFEGPTLFLAGANSAYVQPQHRAEMKRLFPNHRLAKIPNAGHWLHADQPVHVAAALRAFLTA